MRPGAYVHQRANDLTLVEDGQRLLGIARDEEPEAGVVQEVAQKGRDVGLVLHHQHRPWHARIVVHAHKDQPPFSQSLRRACAARSSATGVLEVTAERPEGSTEMTRLTTTLTSAAAAGLTALAVTVAAPASGGDTPPDKEAGTVEHREGGMSAQELQTCLLENGATGVPGEEGEGRALKEWIVAHQNDDSARAALKACDVYFGDEKPDQVGPTGKPDCGPVTVDKPEAVAPAEGTGRTSTARMSPAV